MEIKFLFTKADAGVIKGFRTKADLAWGGVPFGEKKFLFTKAHPGVTKDFAPRQTSRGGGVPFGEKNSSSPRLTPE